jgi:transcriptional regulator with XRE-family HTH domain
MRLSEIGMSKADFYDRSGISSASFSQWRTGTYKPSLKKMENAAAVLGVSSDYLVNGLYRSETLSLSNGVTVFRGSFQQELDACVSDLAAGTYRIVFRGPGVIITVNNDSTLSDEQIGDIVAIYSSHGQKDKAPTNGERSVSDDDIKFALFGGDGEITDEMYDEVKRFAAYIKQREADKK